jgi:alkaline phosphatase
MKKVKLLLISLFLLVSNSLVVGGEGIKNVILLIPDGVSLPVVSAARWLQWYQEPEKPHLNIDAYLCGTIFTHSSNAPIGDSAPTMSCYMTGYPSRAGYISTRPVPDKENDIFPNDPTRARQPVITLLEAARLVRKKATGLVFTCEFPHATPAACAAHSYNRSKYEWIVPQMVHNDLDVVIGGGASLLTAEWEEYLRGQGKEVLLNDLEGFRNHRGNGLWALFGDMDMAYEIDRDAKKQPSLAEMTGKAIEELAMKGEGFFLMVEGSKTDWAAHANDAAALLRDMLAFDDACGVALDFARRDGETLVIVVPDHGNSGFSIGSNRCGNYTTLTKGEIWGPLTQLKTSVEGLIGILKQTDAGELKAVARELTGIELSDSEYEQLLQCSDYDRSSLSNEERMKGSELTQIISAIIRDHHCIGFTTRGHTGEEVFLAVYDPRGSRFTGFHTNVELHHYMREALGLDSLDVLTDACFAKYSDVFEGYACRIVPEVPRLTVKKRRKVLEISPNTNIVLLNGKEVRLSTVVVYDDEEQMFYLPRSLRQLLEP